MPYDATTQQSENIADIDCRLGECDDRNLNWRGWPMPMVEATGQIERRSKSLLAPSVGDDYHASCALQ